MNMFMALTRPNESLFPQEVLGVVEAMRRGWSGKGSHPERGKGSASVMLTEKRVGVVTKMPLVAPRTRQMMMAGPLSAAEQQPLHPIGPVND